MNDWKEKLAQHWAAWKKRHWEPRHNVGFHADDMFISLGVTVYPPLRRAARWLAERRDSIVEKILVGAALAILAALGAGLMHLFR